MSEAFEAWIENDLLYLARALDSFPQLRERFAALEQRADMLRHAP